MRKRDRAFAISLAALAIAGSAALPASAQPVQPEPAPGAAGPEALPSLSAAQELRARAKIALSSGDVAIACQLFGDGYQAATAPGSGVSPEDALFDLASCHERQGKSALAASEFGQIASASGPRAAEARTRASALKASQALAAPGEAPLDGIPGAVVPPPPKEEAPTPLSDFMDTRLSWTFGDDDVLHQSGETAIASPNPTISDRKPYRLFFDNLNSRFGGRENLTHLALYKKMPGFIRRLDTEASLVLRFDIGALSTNSGNLNLAFYDSGSYVRAFYHTGRDPDGKSGLGVTLWPLDTDRLRLGYLYDISWGGTNAAILQSIFPGIQGGAPGGKVQYDGDIWSAYAGFKTATIVQNELTLRPGTGNDVEKTRIIQANYGFLLGGSVDPLDILHFDLGGGYFQQGKFEFSDVAGEPVYTFGGSARVVVHHKDMPIGQSIDFLLYRNDPNKPQIIFKPDVYTPGKTTWSASFEFSNLFQNLKDFDATGKTRRQQARAAALQANIKSGFLRGSLTGIYRDLPFVLRNQPSMISFETLPEAAATSNEIFLAAAVDYFFPRLHLTPGIGAGLQFPATFKSITVDSATTPINRTVVVREQGNQSNLPLNRAAVPIFQARGSLKWDLSRILSALVWVQYSRDNNGTYLATDPNEGTRVGRAFLRPDFLGFGASVQARF